MRHLKIIAAIAIALPVAAIAQVGPNPSVSGGSLDPTMGPSRDTVTAPQDAGTGLSTDTMMSPTGSPSDSTGTTTGSTVTTSGTDTSATTTTGTHSGTKGMKKGRAPKG